MLRSAVPDEDLAPPPSDEDIFGQIESIKQQFAEENQQLNRQLEENKVRANAFKYKLDVTYLFQMRMEANFQEKLAARRQRRARHKLEKSELAEYKESKKDKKDKKHHKKDKKHHKDKKHKKDKQHDDDNHDQDPEQPDEEHE